MITIRPGSHVHTLLTVLSFVGEYPVTALGLLGSVRSYKDLIHRLTMHCLIPRSDPITEAALPMMPMKMGNSSFPFWTGISGACFGSVRPF